jgi:lysophospholipase L1-like esterase
MSINVNDKNLGHATAYAYYKAGGGTMTEAEFTEFMADFGTASQTAVEAAQAALASETAARTAETTATNKASEATTAAQTATTKAGEASTSASTATSAKDTAVSASQTATSKASEATTAAATATSAKTDAVAANTAAQSAKTAAQTAQTGAETAAASVAESAEQIATNTADISQLKSDLSDVKDLTIVTDETVITTDILNTLTWTSGYMGMNGSTGTGSNLRYSNKMSVSKGDVLDVLPTTTSFRFVCAFDGDTPVSASGAQNVKTYTVPDGIDGVVLTVYIPASSYAATGINYTTKEYTSKNIYDDDIAELTANVNAIGEAVTVEQYQKETETDIIPTFSNGFMDTNGNVNDTGSSSGFDYTQKIPVQAGDEVSIWRDANSNSYEMRFVCAFSGDTVVSASGWNNSGNVSAPYVVPEGINGVVVSVRDSYRINTIKVIHRGSEKSAYVKPIPLGFMAESGSLSSGDKLTLPYMQVKLYNRIVFNANVSAFSSIFYSMETVKVEVDSTNLLITNASGTALTPVPHGLTIGKNITLIIENETEEYISHVRVCSDGNVFDYTSKFYAPSANAAQYVQSSGSTLTECVLSWVSQNINAPIWVFGDSYLSLYNARWTYYLIKDGYTKNVMLNGYAGQASATDYNALVNLLETTTPKMVVWCLGMNDPDASDAVNESWKAIYDKVIERQKEYGFELILYTVPTTPTMNNRFKDAIVRESGYRYIEADKAVRINDNGDWISGTLNSDNVHPTETGAKVLYNRILADLPEIMCNR